MRNLKRGRASFSAKSAAGWAALLIAASACGVGVSPQAPASEATDTTEQPMIRTCSAAGAGFHDGMRKLWEDHILWTRQVIVSFVAGSEDLNPTLDRLLQNQGDIGNAIKPYYGNDAGDALTLLLRQHILLAANVLAAAKAGDDAGLKTALDHWYTNGNDIAAFLSGANPDNWPLAEMQQMMRDHLDATLTEAVARLQGRYVDDIAAFDAVHVQALGMADMLSAGIIVQFKNKFK